MEEKTKTITLSVMITLLISLGLQIPTMIEGSPNYFCSDRPEIGIMTCDRFSSTGLRCYPTEGTTKGYKDCKIGWSEVIDDTPVYEEPINDNQTVTIPIVFSIKDINDLIKYNVYVTKEMKFELKSDVSAEELIRSAIEIVELEKVDDIK